MKLPGFLIKIIVSTQIDRTFVKILDYESRSNYALEKGFAV